MNFIYIYIILRQFIRYIIIIILSNRIDSLSDWWDSSLRSAFLELLLCACLYFLLNCSACPWLVFDLLLNCSALPWVVQPLVTWNFRWSSRNMGDAPSKSSCIRTLTLQGNLDLLLEAPTASVEEHSYTEFLEVYPVVVDQAILNEEADLELGSEANCEPMKLMSYAERGMWVFRHSQDDSCCCVRDRWVTVEL